MFTHCSKPSNQDDLLGEKENKECENLAKMMMASNLIFFYLALWKRVLFSNLISVFVDLYYVKVSSENSSLLCITNVPTHFSLCSHSHFVLWSYAYIQIIHVLQMTLRIVVALQSSCQTTPFPPLLLCGKLQVPLFTSNRVWGGMWPRPHESLTSTSLRLSMTRYTWNYNGLHLETTTTKEEVITEILLQFSSLFAAASTPKIFKDVVWQSQLGSYTWGELAIIKASFFNFTFPLFCS